MKVSSKPVKLNFHSREARAENGHIVKPAENVLNIHSQLLDTIEQSVIATNLDGIVIYWNQFARMLYGWSAEETIGRNIRELTTPKSSVRQAEEIMSQLRQGKNWTGEFTVRRKNGTTFPAQITNSPIYDEKRNLIGIVGVSNDITERKQVEERLKQSEEWLRSIFEASHDGILVEDNERIIYVNKSYVNLFGYDDAQELVGQHVSHIISSEDLSRVSEFGKSRLRAGEQPPTKYEFKGKKKDGTSIDVEASVSTSKALGSTYITTMLRDISERKRMEILIEAQKQSLEMVIKGAPLPEVLTYLTRIVEQQTDGQTVASILLLDEQGCLHNGASPNLPEYYLQAIDGLKADVNVGTCSSAAASRNIVITPDIAADPKWQGLAHLPLELGFKAAWTMPIIARDGHVLGTFGTYFRERREPTAIERRIVEILGRTAALAIEGKQTEEVLRASENQLRLVTDAIPLLVSYVDREHRYRFINRTYTKWFGRAREEVVGKHLSEVLGQIAYQAILPEIEKALSGKEAVFELLVPYKTGERFIHLNYVPEFDQSTAEVLGFHAFVQDITGRKQAEEVLQRSQEELEILVKERTNELEAANEERIGILHQLVTAQEDERQRIARDLHDQLGQQMTVLRLKLGFLKKNCSSNEDLHKQVDEIQKIARQIDLDVDFLAWKFRPAVLDDVGLVAALEQYSGQWSAHFNIPVEFNAARFAKIRLEPEVETNFYRITQEALNNIYKYAAASKVNILLEPRDDDAGSVVLIIEDDGIGFEPDNQSSSEKGMGLKGMRERAALIGGKLEIESAKGVGTTVFASIPYPRAEDEKKNE